METKVSKIQFRQGTKTEWESANPIPAIGEPCYEIDTKVFKIGDGVSHYNNLEPQVLPEDFAFIQEPIAANNVKYARARDEGETVGKWVRLPEEDTRKTIADLLASDYGTELDMNYKVRTVNGDKEVYGIKYHQLINAGINELVEIVIKTNITKLLLVNGIISSDDHHDYLLPVNTTKFSANVLLDEENGSLSVVSKSDEIRTQAPLDIIVLYTKD